MNVLELSSNKIWGVASGFNTLLAPKSPSVDSGAGLVLRLLGLLFLFFLILVGAVYVTKFIASKSAQFGNNNIKIIETYRTSTTSAIQIIRIADKFLAVAICKDKISLLATLDEDSVIVSDSNTQLQGMDFSELFNKAKDKIRMEKKDKN